MLMELARGPQAAAKPRRAATPQRAASSRGAHAAAACGEATAAAIAAGLTSRSPDERSDCLVGRFDSCRALDPMNDRELLLDRLREHGSRGPTELLRYHRDWLGPCKLPEPMRSSSLHDCFQRAMSPGPATQAPRPTRIVVVPLTKCSRSRCAAHGKGRSVSSSRFGTNCTCHSRAPSSDGRLCADLAMPSPATCPYAASKEKRHETITSRLHFEIARRFVEIAQDVQVARDETSLFPSSLCTPIQGMHEAIWRKPCAARLQRHVCFSNCTQTCRNRSSCALRRARPNVITPMRSCAEKYWRNNAALRCDPESTGPALWRAAQCSLAPRPWPQ